MNIMIKLNKKKQ